MKRILTAWALTAVVSVCAAQTIVRMPVKQNPLFAVSTNKVELTMPAGGGGLILGGNVVIEGGSGNYSYRWYSPTGTELGTESTCQVNEAGTYMLDVTDSCDCLQTVEFNLASAGIGSTEVEGMKIGPNPTSGVIYISGFDAVRVAAIDMSGRLAAVAEGDGTALESVDFSGLAQGEYILTLADGDGRMVTHRIIIR